MNVLVDTHAVLWWLTANPRLSRRAKLILADPANRRMVSMTSLWEIAIKMGTGRLPAQGLTLKSIAEALAMQQFVLRGIQADDLFRMETLPWLHRDPFDRLLIAQAQVESVPLLTADAMMTRYAVQTIW